MTTPFEPPAPTQAEIDTQSVSALAANDAMTLNTLKINVTTSFNMLWNNPNSTPQGILNIYGTSAAQLFQVFQTTCQFIIGLDPTWVLPTPPQTFVVNSDGTVTTPAPVTTGG